jgi:dTDP-glucose 4,6-dehydratase
MHLAAESHVDRSIDGPADFVQTNMWSAPRGAARGRPRLLAKLALDPDARATFRFHHMSRPTRSTARSARPSLFSLKGHRLRSPNSPYSASKAGSDHLVRAWGETYGLPVHGHELLEQLRPVPVSPKS